jgi:hypothetical protein
MSQARPILEKPKVLIEYQDVQHAKHNTYCPCGSYSANCPRQNAFPEWEGHSLRRANTPKSSRSRAASMQYSMYVIRNTKLSGSELRVVIEAVVVQNNPIHYRQCGNGGSIASFTVGAVWDSTVVKGLRRRIRRCSLGWLCGLDRA